MKLNGTYTFEAPLAVVWEALFDPEVLAATLPGCEGLEREGQRFTGDIFVKMGPVQGRFRGQVDIEDIVELTSYRMLVDGKGPAGFVKATGELQLSSDGERTTQLSYQADVRVGGRIASVGQRLLDASSKAIVKQSLESLNSQIRARAEQEAKANGVEAAAEAGGNGESEESPSERAEERPRPPAVRAPASPAAVSGPSQAAFAMGVAREVTKELVPMRKLLLVACLVALLVALYQVLVQ